MICVFIYIPRNFSYPRSLAGVSASLARILLPQESVFQSVITSALRPTSPMREFPLAVTPKRKTFSSLVLLKLKAEPRASTLIFEIPHTTHCLCAILLLIYKLCLVDDIIDAPWQISSAHLDQILLQLASRSVLTATLSPAVASSIRHLLRVAIFKTWIYSISFLISLQQRTRARTFESLLVAYFALFPFLLSGDLISLTTDIVDISR